MRCEMENWIGVRKVRGAGGKLFGNIARERDAGFMLVLFGKLLYDFNAP